MLSNTISPRVMKLGLRNYLHKYQYKNVNDTQLWSELTKVADDEHLPSWNDQPLNVATLMDPWMYQATYPVLKLTTKDGQVTYSQEPFILNTSALQPSPYKFEWTIPVFSQLQRGGEVFHYFRGKDGENPFWTRQLTNEWQVENPAFKVRISKISASQINKTRQFLRKKYL
ncbi:unnamed protein product [Anisakis simplex]|uniref:Peptidase_M1 domain-containing protein n=1 Tax=Anisakis simplex TaxID=6269 RepID=A0A0M3J7M9_ANISI|nr:unnamed protein product [Anisakis simplex]